MNDLKLNSNGDLDILGGDLQLLNDEAEVSRQSLQIDLKTFRGEWFLDTSIGVPYLQRLLKKGVSKTFVDNVFIDKVRKAYQIDYINAFNSVITSDRRYVINELTATTVGGEIISVSNLVI